MSVKKAVAKHILRKSNESHTEKELKNAPDKAYKMTGKEIDKAKKNGNFINGKQRYKDNKKKIQNDILKKSKDRDKFIDDL